MPDDLSHDAFLGGRLRLWQPRQGYRAATDPVLLAAAVPARAGQRVLDLGCGVGTSALCLSARVPGLDLHGLELQPDLAALARRNAAGAGVLLTLHEGDAARPPPELRQLVFDHVLANPPWHAAAGAVASPDASRDLANREGALGLEGWVAAGLRRLRPGGRLSLIQRAERLGEILAALAGAAGGVRVLPLQPREGMPAGRVIVQAVKGSRAPMTLLAPFVLHRGARHEADGEDFTPAAQAVLRGGAALPLDPPG